MEVPNDMLHAEEKGETIQEAINLLEEDLKQKIKNYKGQYEAQRRKHQKAVRAMKESGGVA